MHALGNGCSCNYTEGMDVVEMDVLADGCYHGFAPGCCRKVVICGSMENRGISALWKAIGGNANVQATPPVQVVQGVVCRSYAGSARITCCICANKRGE